MLINGVDVLTILTDVKAQMLLMHGRCKMALALVMAIQILWGGVQLILYGKKPWNAFIFPIIGATLMYSYDGFVHELVAIPQDIGWTYASSASDRALLDTLDTATQWGKGGGVLQIILESLWAVVIKSMLYITVLVSILAFMLLELFQVGAIGILYVIGPFFVLLASTEYTWRFTLTWALEIFKVSMWTLTWGVLLSVAVHIGSKVPPLPANWWDITSMMVTLQNMAVHVAYIFLTLFTPKITNGMFNGAAGTAAAGAAAVIPRIFTR